MTAWVNSDLKPRLLWGLMGNPTEQNISPVCISSYRKLLACSEAPQENVFYITIDPFWSLLKRPVKWSWVTGLPLETLPSCPPLYLGGFVLYSNSFLCLDLLYSFNLHALSWCSSGFQENLSKSCCPSIAAAHTNK